MISECLQGLNERISVPEYVTKRGVGTHRVVCVRINVCERQGMFDWDVSVTQCT